MVGKTFLFNIIISVKNCLTFFSLLKTGAFFSREKRIKFSERWRQLLDIDPANGLPQISHSPFLEFLNSGLSDIVKEPEYGPCLKNVEVTTTAPSSLYASQINTEQHGIPKVYKDLFQDTQMTDDQIRSEISFFHDYINDMAMILTFGLKSINAYKNLFEIAGELNERERELLFFKRSILKLFV